MAAAGGLREMTDQNPSEPDWRSGVVRDEARRAHDRADSFFEQVNEAVIKNGESAFRACLLINGGAAVSVLAFIGRLASKDVIGVSQLASVADSLILFALGVVAAVYKNELADHDCSPLCTKKRPPKRPQKACPIK